MIRTFLLGCLVAGALAGFKCKIKDSETLGESCPNGTVACAAAVSSKGKRVLFDNIDKACVSKKEFTGTPYFSQENTCGNIGSQTVCWCNNDKLFGCNTQGRVEEIYKDFNIKKNSFTCKIKDSETLGESCPDGTVACAAAVSSKGKRVLFDNIEKACVSKKEFTETPYFSQENVCGTIGSQTVCWCNKDRFFGCNTEGRVEEIFKDFKKKSFTCKTRPDQIAGETCPPGTVACQSGFTKNGKRKLFVTVKDSCVNAQDFKHSAPYNNQTNTCGKVGAEIICWCNQDKLFGCNTKVRMEEEYKLYHQ